jgi:hypothetical protein
MRVSHIMIKFYGLSDEFVLINTLSGSWHCGIVAYLIL